MKAAIVLPHLPYTSIIVNKDDHNKVLGTVVCATKKELSNMPVTKYENCIDPKVAKLFENIFSFEITNSYHISFLAIATEFRGKGLGKALLKHAEEKCDLAGYDTLSLYTVSC